MPKKITRLRNIDATRVDGVDGPANGFPVLMMKAVNAQGGIDEKPDIAGAKGILVDLFKLIAAEAQEGATGAFGEIHDIAMLCDAICAIQCFLWNEQAGDMDDGETAYKSLAPVTKAEAESLAAWVLKRKFSAARRKELASEGNALPDGSYPIENEEDLHNAAILARSGHGDVAAAKRHIAKRAKELGVANPLAAEKSADQPVKPEDGQEVTPEAEAEVAKAEDPAPPAPEDAAGPELDPVVKSAIADAVAPLEAANQELRDQLEVLKATPIPGGPALTAPADAVALSARTEKLAKAAQYRRLASQVTDREHAKYYRDRADELEKA
jgi:hypothetical protein